MTVRWVVQTNLGKHYSEDLERACANLGLPFIPVQAIPFSDELPDIDSSEPTVFYGATRWITNIYNSQKWVPGAFFNPRSVFTRWSKKYGKHVLNSDAKVTTLIKLAKENRPEPVGIAHEWRLFIVNGRVSSGSHYRRYHKLKEDPYIPPEVIKFAEARCWEYMPTEVFVMDIGESAGNLYIIEIGCFNSAGFYASDVEKIIKDISDHVAGSNYAKSIG